MITTLKQVHLVQSAVRPTNYGQTDRVVELALFGVKLSSFLSAVLLRVFAPESLTVPTGTVYTLTRLTPEEQSAALSACALVRQGDVILTCTPGKSYETLRLLSNSAYDHVVSPP
jgi:hypothetical protein